VRTQPMIKIQHLENKVQMKSFLGVLIIITVLSSCEKDNFSYPDALRNRFIVSICLKDDYKFILTSRGCDTCYVPSYCSYRPSINEVSIVNGSVIKNCLGSLSSSVLKANSNSDIYLLQGKKLYLISETGNSTEVLNTNDQFTDFTFDQSDNIWFWKYDKIAYWDHKDLILYSAKDSLSPDDRGVHGLTVDFSGKVWICSDYNLVKIDAGKWTVMPTSQILGTDGNRILYNLIATDDNSIWFESSHPSEKGLLRYKNGSLTFSRPDTTKYSSLIQDAEGTLWANSRHYGFNEKGYTILLYSTLRYFHDEEWVDVDVSDIKQFINTVNVSESKIYIGTNNGIVEKPRQ
jgi:hypothetical protein